MGKVVCLLGKSCSGKDTVYNALLADKELALEPLVLYTTRPARAGEEDGKTYHFVTERQLAELGLRYGIIERRVYHTVFGPWAYCTLNDGQARGENRICITTPAAIGGYFSAFGRGNVLPFYLRAEDGRRLRRAIEREERQLKPAYDEVCRRYLADEEDFSEEKLALCGLAGRYDNNELEACVRAIKRDMIKLL